MSAAIANIRFPLILMIVLLHCYCSIHAYGHPIYTKVVYPLGLWLGETGVPAFFFISGFLFFYRDKSYSAKLHSRFYSLFVPYFFWNALILCCYWLLSIIGHPILVVGKDVGTYGVVDFVRAFVDRGDWDHGNGVPMLCPYWYIRNLIVICIFSPILYYAIKYLKLVFIAIVFLWWITIPYNGMIASSILFFSFGAYFSIFRKDLLSLLQKRSKFFTVLWIVVFLIDWIGHTMWTIPYGLFWHRISLVLNIMAFLLIGSYIGDKSYPGKALLGKSSFWIYTVHFPLTIAIGLFHNRYLQEITDGQLFVYYIVSVFVVTFMCVITYVVLHKICPTFLSFILGSRI